MRSKFPWLSDYWQGLLLGVCGIVVSIWFGLTGKLDLYIHPRYIIFSMVMSILSLAVLLAGMWRRLHHAKITSHATLIHILAGSICIALSVCLLVTKPSALTSSTATQRGVNTASLDLSTQSTGPTISANTDYSRFTVKEWASLLAQTTDTSYFVSKKVNLTGFIAPVANDPDSFYVSRFIITCCAVDARAIGVPVYAPNWRATYRENQWVQLDGSFMKNLERSDPPVLVKPGTINKISEPSDPYAY